jgi:hypothetical protein
LGLKRQAKILSKGQTEAVLAYLTATRYPERNRAIAAATGALARSPAHRAALERLKARFCDASHGGRANGLLTAPHLDDAKRRKDGRGRRSVGDKCRRPPSAALEGWAGD